jgi:hypothetical protein
MRDSHIRLRDTEMLYNILEILTTQLDESWTLQNFQSLDRSLKCFVFSLPNNWFIKISKEKHEI